MNRFLLLCILIGRSVLAATHYESFELQSWIGYRDAEQSCESEVGLGTETKLLIVTDEIGQTQATLRYDGLFFGKRDRRLSDDEVKSIVWYRDNYGRNWIHKISLSEETMTWLFYRVASLKCDLSKGMKTAAPSPMTFVFDTDGLGEEMLVSHSKNVSFSGVRKDDKTYDAKIKFIQRRRV